MQRAHLRPISAARTTLMGRSADWSLRLARQLAVVLVAVFAYRLVRAATEGEHDVALRHGFDVLRLERSLGLDVEQAVQRPVLASRLLIDVANTIYTWGFWSIVSLALLVLFIADRERFRHYRNAMFISGSFGLAIFALFPVAPPRMLDGFVDTVHVYSRSGGIAHPGSFTNVYAAMPSFHFGWLVLAGVATMPIVPCRAARPLLLLPAALMGWTVLATANHYVLDGVVGAVLAMGGLMFARRLPPLALVWRTIDVRLQPYGGPGVVAASVGVTVGRSLLPFMSGQAVHAYYSAATERSTVTRRPAA